jgi:tryptophan synthase beta chain
MIAPDSPPTLARPGRFGPFGGAYVPEILVGALARLEAAVARHLDSDEFRRELAREARDWIGRETPLTFAPRLTEAFGARVHLKREDLCHTGAHKINNALGQALLARRMGARRVIAETGAGQHGVATAAACARLGLPCTVYMGAHDVARQALNVRRMELFGAEVRAVTALDATLRAAIDEALRDWSHDPEGTYYLLGSAVGPHPYPMLVRELQSVIGRETRAQFLAAHGRLPDIVLACVGGGSNALGMFHAFRADEGVELVGVEAGGRGDSPGQHGATLTHGRPGVLHGTYSYLLQDEHGQVVGTHSISAGLDYPGVGPEHAALKDSGRARYFAVSDEEALAALEECAKLEGILPALESAHALAGARHVAHAQPGAELVVCCSGRGDKDLGILAEARGGAA